MNLKHVPPSAPTAMLDRQEGKGSEGRRIDGIMKKMTINSNNNNNNNNNNTAKEPKEDA
jgi:hypothetical protein